MARHNNTITTALLIFGTILVLPPTNVSGLECGGTFNNSTGSITSPNYPDAYYKEDLCEWFIKATEGSIVKFTFHAPFDVEWWNDHLEFIDISPSGTHYKWLKLSGHSFPSQFKSRTNNVLVRFLSSPGVEQHKGFNVTWEEIAPDNECGGRLYDPTGSISSPYYPDNYIVDDYCHWSIEMPLGYLIRLTFHHPFHLDDVFEVLTIKEIGPFGYSRGKPVVNKGDKLPPVFTSRTNKVSIEFETGTSWTYQGFNLTWERLPAEKGCGGTFNSTTGTLASPNYPYDYNDNDDCTWVLEMPSEHDALRFEFQDFNLQTYFDHLEISDTRPDEVVVRNQTFTGDRLPEYFISRTSRVVIKFRSDSSVVRKGFQLTWEKVATTCGKAVTGTEGEITSQNYPDNYNNNTVCTWNISVESGRLIQLTFHSPFDVAYDIFQLFEVDPFGVRTMRRRFKGDKVPAVYTSITNSVELVFDIGHDVHKGFNFTWKEISLRPCGGISSGDEGSISTPNFPDLYKDTIDLCSWFIEVPDGNFIRLTFQKPYEIGKGLVPLQVYQTDPQGVRSVRNKHWNNLFPRPYTSITNKIEVAFDPHLAINGSRFNITWEKVDTTCGGAIDGNQTGGHGTIPVNTTSDKHINCDWIIEVPQGFHINLLVHALPTTPYSAFYLLHFRALGFNLLPRRYYTDRRCSDFVQSSLAEAIGFTNTIHLIQLGISDIIVYDVTETGDRNIRLHSVDKFPFSILSNTNRMEVVIIGREKEFNITWQKVDLRCGGPRTGKSGVIESPNYPYLYPQNANCRWTINVPIGKFIHFKFQEQFLVNYRDYIEVFETSSEGKSIKRAHYTGFLFYPAYVSTTNQVVITFVSFTSSSERTGFKLLWEEVDETSCGQLVDVQHGVPSFHHVLPTGDSKCLAPSSKPNRCRLLFGTYFDFDHICVDGSFSIPCSGNRTAKIIIDGTEIGCGGPFVHKVCAPQNEALHVIYEGNLLCPSDMPEEIARFTNAFLYTYIDADNGTGHHHQFTTPHPHHDENNGDDKDQLVYLCFLLIMPGVALIVLGIVFFTRRNTRSTSGKINY